MEIAIDPNRLNAHGLSINELSERLRTLNFSISAGQIDDNGQRVRVQARPQPGLPAQPAPSTTTTQGT